MPPPLKTPILQNHQRQEIQKGKIIGGLSLKVIRKNIKRINKIFACNYGMIEFEYMCVSFDDKGATKEYPHLSNTKTHRWRNGRKKECK